MPYYERKCLSCGQTVIKGDTICRSCGSRLQDNCQYIEKDTINGVPISDMSLFIDKNSSRYIDIFAKNRDKKIFFNMNWAAMFFNVYWMFYRKMYKYAIVFLIVSFLFTLGLTTAVSAHFKPQVAEADKIIAPYTEYIEGTNGFYGSYFDGTVSYEEIMYAKSEYNKEINSITAKIGFWLMIPSLIFGAVFGMLADCIYRRFVMKKCRYTEGGTSIGSMIVGIVVYQVATNLIISPIITDVAFKILR